MQVQNWSLKMQKRSPLLNPDLVIGKETAIDRMGATAARSAELQKPNFTKQIQLVRNYALQLCSRYLNCRKEDWCFHCASGQDNAHLFMGKACLDCKLLTSDAHLKHKPKLVQISQGIILQTLSPMNADLTDESQSSID